MGIFSRRPEPPTIERFQFENLCSQKVPFLFIDISIKAQTAPLAKGMSVAVRVTAQDVAEYLTKTSMTVDHPIVIICEDGRRSKKLAQKLLLKSDYKNLFVLDGGWSCLVSDSKFD
jgi:rhodanese-related sulfurtransferase